jgi:tRNA-specific 2-thiouridylase
VDEEGRVLGEHKGLIRYTIGQRRGLGLALPAPLYVSRIDTAKNQVVLTPEDRLFSKRLVAEDFNWIWLPDRGALEGASPPAGYEVEVTAKPRYRAKEAAATARVLEGGKVEILFHEPQRALTVGQAVVVYRGENVVGGGTICEVPPAQTAGA